jgi:hypothetical protein
MSKKQTRKKKARAFWAMNAAGFRAIGRFTFELSQLEFSIRAVLAGHLELPAKYFDIVTAPYDFAMLCKVFREVVGADKSNAQKKQLERWCDACLALNTERVRIAHGTWTLGSEGPSARVVSRSTLKPKSYFGTPEEIDRLSDEAEHLKGQTIVVSGLSGDP